VYAFGCWYGAPLHPPVAPDGGAGSITGMDISVAGARGIIFAFALWESAQLIFMTRQRV